MTKRKKVDPLVLGLHIATAEVRAKRVEMGLAVSVATHYYKFGRVVQLQWLESLILRGDLYIPRITELNDPSEGRWAEGERGWAEVWESMLLLGDDLLRFKLEMAKIAAKLNPAKGNGELSATDYLRIRREHVAEKRDRELSQIGVISLTKRWHNLALWAKYADEHRGYCLEFGEEGVFLRAMPVIYRNLNRSKLKNQWDFLFRKTPEWSNEEELRVVIHDHAGSVFQLKPTTILRQIILGSKMPKDQHGEICRWAAMRKPALSVAIARFDSSRLRMSLEDA